MCRAQLLLPFSTIRAFEIYEAWHWYTTSSNGGRRNNLELRRSNQLTLYARTVYTVLAVHWKFPTFPLASRAWRFVFSINQRASFETRCKYSENFENWKVFGKKNNEKMKIVFFVSFFVNCPPCIRWRSKKFPLFFGNRGNIRKFASEIKCIRWKTRLYYT